MNYKKVYDNIINRAKDRNWNRLSALEYVERHHIVPRSLGGKDTRDNLVFLTAREHFICHWLLFKLSEGSNKSKMANAWFRMCQTNEFQSRYNSKHYSRARKAFSENNPFKSTDIIEKVKNRMIKNNPMKNPQISDKVRQALKGKFAGEKNKSFDSKIYSFKNKLTNEILTMTQYDFYSTKNLDQAHVSKLVRKVPGMNSVKGWVLL